MNDVAQPFNEEPQIYRIGRYDRITISGTHYQLLGSHALHHEVVTVKAPERCEEFTHAKFYDLFSRGLIKIEKEFFSPDSVRIRGEWSDITLSNFPEEKARLALFYADYLNEFIRMRADDRKGVTLSEPSLDRVLPEIEKRLNARKADPRSGRPRKGDFDPPQPRTFRRLYKKYVDGGYRAVALIKKKTGRTRATTFPLHDIQFWSEFAAMYASRTRPTKAGLLVALKAELQTRNPNRLADGLALLTAPKRKYFEKMIDKLDPFFVVSRREGLKAARERFRITYQGLEVERPMERVEMDEWKIDLSVALAHLQVWEKLNRKEQEAVKKSRLWLTVAIDCATRVILAMRFSDRAPNGQSALAALEMAMIDKTQISQAVGTILPWVGSGRIEELIADNGAGFDCHAFRTAAADSRIAYSNPPAGEAPLRPFIETVFKTMSVQFLQWFEGRTFSNFIEKGDYDPAKNACICVDELNRIFVRAVVDMYHQRHHEGLGGETPYNAWLRLSRKHGVESPPDIEERRHVFGINLERVLGDKGVLFFGLHYQSAALQRLRVNLATRTVRIRVNRFDISKISVAVEGGGWLTVGSSYNLPPDVSIWEWLAAAREHTLIHAENARPGLSAMYATINRLREDGTAAYARSEFGTPPPGARTIAAEERRHFRRIQFVDDMKEEKFSLSPLAYPEIPPADAHSIVPYTFKTDDEETEPDPTLDQGKIDPDDGVVVSSESQFGSVDTLRFED